jgi:hypothetical protein
MEKKSLIKFLGVGISFVFYSIIFAQGNSAANFLNDIFCIQVVTPAKNPVTGECKEFPTPCDVPPGWVKVEKCFGSVITIPSEEKRVPTCKEYFWYDEKNLNCQGPKTFCGFFMYKGLYVFEKKEVCEKSLLENPKFIEKKKTEIKKEMQERDQISFEEFEKIGGKISFLPGVVELGNERINLEQEKKFIAKVGESTLEILLSQDKLKLKEGDKISEVEGTLSIEDGKLFLEGKEIKLTPDLLIEKLNIQNLLNLEMKLKLEGENPVYWIRFTQEKKVLGIFPLKIQREMEVVAQTQEVKKLRESKKPLFQFWFFKF